MTIKLPDENVVIELHDIVLMVSPGRPGIHDMNQVHAAVQRPLTYTQYVSEYDLDTVCALLIDSIARNHGFKDANKRTSLMTAIFTYRVNDVHFKATTEMNIDFDNLIMWVVLEKPLIDEVIVRLRQLRNRHETDKASWKDIIRSFINAKINHDK